VGVAQRIQQVSKDVLQIGQGSLYPALHRLEYKGWIRADWGASENNRRAKFYSLTATGRKQLQAELKTWIGCRMRSAWCWGWWLWRLRWRRRGRR
jgi:PadR family transcriptional regulator PadR